MTSHLITQLSEGHDEVLSDEWLTPEEQRLRNLAREDAQARLRLPRPPVLEGDSHPLSPASEGAATSPAQQSASLPSVSAPVPAPVSAPVAPVAPPTPPTTPAHPTPAPVPPPIQGPTPGSPHDDSDDTSRYPSRSRGNWKDGPALDRKYSKGQWKTGLTCLLALPMHALSAMSSWTQPPSHLCNFGASSGARMTQQRYHKSQLNEMALLSGDWSKIGESTCFGHLTVFSSYLQPDLSDDLHSLTVTDVQPHILSAKSVANQADSPNLCEALDGPNAENWWEAMKIEFTTLEQDLKTWSLVERQDWMHVLPSVWAFRLKRYPNGLAKKFKARFCVRGDKQVEGVDYFETWSPVVQWTTVRAMMILSTKLQLHTAQADITAAFVHAELDDNEHIYVSQPAGFNRGKNLVLKLHRSVYGLKQSPRNFFQYLVKHLAAQGLTQSENDPCLFIGRNITVIVYVDDLLLFAQDKQFIDKLIGNLQGAGIQIRVEGDAEGFLGVDIKREDTGIGPRITLTQEGLAKRIVEALGLCSSFSTAISTPAEASPLPKDASGDPASGSFNYAAVIGMMLYLSGHSRPDIAFAVHQCARYTFAPTRRHEAALVRIGRYLKGTMHRGLIMSPCNDPRLDCFPDADFAGLYGHEDSQDPHCARSRTGYVILAFNCPVLWRSRLQTEIALSTMEAEYVALSTACKDLLPLIHTMRELCIAVGLPKSFGANMHIKIHEDNVGALTLSQLEPKRMTPRSKHYAIKYHWFREKIHDPSYNISIHKVDSKLQLWDIFTKGLVKEPFERLRRLLMGW